MNKKKIIKIYGSKIILGFAIVLVLIATLNVFQISAAKTLTVEKLAVAKEVAKPAELQITIISTDCENCYDINAVKTIVESLSDVIIKNVKEVPYNTDEGAKLISKYDIKKLPTMIIEGEIEKSKALSGGINQYTTKAETYFLVDKLVPPYIDTQTGSVVGLVDATIITSSDCENCQDMNLFLNQLEEVGVTIYQKKELDATSGEAQTLIDKYKLDKLPTIVLSQDLEAYPEIAQNWESLGAQKEDGNFVLHITNPPYYSLTEKRDVGAVTIIAIDDPSCQECYDPLTVHKNILGRMGLYLNKESTVDVNSAEGQEILEKYSITSVPTIILQGDMDQYTSFANVWTQVGTREDDGTYVFRSVDIIKQTYKDLESGEVIVAQS